MKNVLIVDDDRFTRDILTRLLDGLECEVRLAENGEDALDMARDRSPDVAVVDMFLPGKGGLDVIQEMRSVSPSSRIVAMTGGESFDPAEVLRLSEALGVTETLLKPLDKDQTVDLISRLLKDGG